ncbi:MAG: PIN domain-containing protein [Candidatus Altiarchaeota archaeon]
MPTFFVDSNLFLQCKKIQEIPWGDVSDEDSTLVLIPRPVQIEIDRLKQSGNTRLAKRAREANSFFRDMIDNNDTFQFNQNSKAICFKFAPNYKTSELEKQDDRLDISKTDDEIIANAIIYRKETSDLDVFLLTHDTNPILTAKQCGLPYKRIPDSWLLAPELDSRDKRIAKLEEEIKTIKKSSPNVKIEHSIDSENSTDGYIEVKTFNDLSEDEKSTIIDQLKSKFPLKDDFSFEHIRKDRTRDYGVMSLLFGEKQFVPPDKEDIEDYKNNRYPDWINKVRSWLNEIPQYLQYPFHRLRLRLNVSNDGNTPIEHFLLAFKSHGGILIKPGDNDLESDEQLKISPIPPPPRLPEGKWIRVNTSFLSQMKGISDLSGTLRDQYLGLIPENIVPYTNSSSRRDRHGIYYKGSRPTDFVDSFECECDEFRHKIDPETFDLIVSIPTDEKIVEGVISCIITGTNLPEPKREHIKLNFKHATGDSYTEVQRLISELNP